MARIAERGGEAPVRNRARFHGRVEVAVHNLSRCGVAEFQRLIFRKEKPVDAPVELRRLYRWEPLTPGIWGVQPLGTPP
jgi:hypothetical protein